MNGFVKGILVSSVSLVILAVLVLSIVESRPTPSMGITYNHPKPSFNPPPSYLLINGERWGVFPYDYAKNKETSEGGTNCGMRDIWYDSNYHTKAEFREILWHEVFHASYCYQGDRMDSNWNQYIHDRAEHEIVYEAGMFLPGFVHDNPEFMKWAEDWK